MGRLIDGVWSNHDLGPDEKGRYVRRAAQFRGRVEADPTSRFPAVVGRYHLYVSYACGWSHRCLIARALKGLQSVVGITVTDPFMGEHGWTLGGDRGPVPEIDKLYELYTQARPDYTGRASVPVLWDTVQATVVSNESIDIVRSLDHAFDELGATGPRLFPPDRDDEIADMIAANYGPINNGVYRAGFAGSQTAHAEAARELFSRLDALEAHLADHRYLLGPDITAADWFLFPTLFRFDAIYHTHFKCNLRRLVDYPHLWGYTRDLYQQPGIAPTCDMGHVKRHYYTSHESIHPRRYIPIGPELDFDAPHGRTGVGVT